METRLTLAEKAETERILDILFGEGEMVFEDVEDVDGRLYYTVSSEDGTRVVRAEIKELTEEELSEYKKQISPIKIDTTKVRLL